MYAIEYAEGVVDDLAGLRAIDRKRILDGIEVQLLHEPTKPARNRKVLIGLVPPWEFVEPVWELRIGEHRVFYDVDDTANTVTVWAIRHKPPHKPTEVIL